MKNTILIVDDELAIIELLDYNLRRNGFQVLIARDGRDALRLARSEQPDLIILDLMLPAIDGLDVCRTLRQESQVPIIMLTARGEEVDRVVGLELGADDYVTKPFSVRELIARVKAVMRRVEAHTGDSGTCRSGDLTLDPLCRDVHLRDQPLTLTQLEFDLLETLMRHAGHVLIREQLLDKVWGYDYHGDTRTVDSAIKRLRAKITQAGGDPQMIATMRGIGLSARCG